MMIDGFCQRVAVNGYGNQDQNVYWVFHRGKHNDTVMLTSIVIMNRRLQFR